MTTVPATAAEALTGPARIRPAGWLATPTPTDPDTLLARARQALEVDHPGVAGTLRLVSARYTAAVFTVHQAAGPLVLKLHADPVAYAGETLAYALLSGAAPTPELYGEGESSLSLLLECLPAAADWTGPGMPAVLAECVATVHTASLRLSQEAAEAMAEFCLARRLLASAPAWIADVAAISEVLAAHLDAYGPALVPLGHLDLKPEHLRLRTDGEVVLLDVETVRPDVTGLIDLVTLPAVLRQAGHELSPTRVLDLYLDATAKCGASWTASSLKAALRAYAAVAELDGDLVAVRDSKDLTRAPHIHPRSAWLGFTALLRRLGAVPFATDRIRVAITTAGVTLYDLHGGVQPHSYTTFEWDCFLDGVRNLEPQLACA